jgi:uroporphyrinogen decarboxylase
MDALALTRRTLNGRVPLIGFSGSPWTLAAYMVEGKGTKDFVAIKQLIYTDPSLAHELLDTLARSVAEYLSAQIAAGAQAVQIFDSWGGILGQDEFEEFSLRYIQQVIAILRRSGEPVIVFCKDCGHSLSKIAASGADVVSLDWTTDLGRAREAVGSRVALQGNLDPTMLFAPPQRIAEGVRTVLEKFGEGSGHIFNLGHGILPETPADHARAMVEAVKQMSVAYHRMDITV